MKNNIICGIILFVIINSTMFLVFKFTKQEPVAATTTPFIVYPANSKQAEESYGSTEKISKIPEKKYEDWVGAWEKERINP